MLYRDLYVTSRELPAFLAQVILQPLFLLFVFGYVLKTLNYTHNGYTNVLYPGLLALTAVITAMQALAFPLVAEFGWTKEIEDRLLAPMPTSFVVGEKVLFAVLRSLTATLIMIPLGIIILGSIPWRWDASPALRRRAAAGSARRRRLRAADGDVRAAASGSACSSPSSSRRCSSPAARQYPWPSLDQIRWFQIVTACSIR